MDVIALQVRFIVAYRTSNSSYGTGVYLSQQTRECHPNENCLHSCAGEIVHNFLGTYAKKDTMKKSLSTSNPTLSLRLGSVCARIKSSLASELTTDDDYNGSFSSLSTCETVQSTVCNEEELAVMEELEAIGAQVCSTPPSSRRNVSFQHVEIRTYDVTLGKHLNEYDLGPSLTLDWSYHNENEEDNKITVDEYEMARMPSRRSTEDLFALSRMEREEILRERGFHKSMLDKVTQSTLIRKQWKNSLEI